ncbi:MAG: hypothetical protein H7A00_02405 [Hahellaceae bacterium]|nr:hypothetical protein [Hahellaceae bacterium]
MKKLTGVRLGLVAVLILGASIYLLLTGKESATVDSYNTLQKNAPERPVSGSEQAKELKLTQSNEIEKAPEAGRELTAREERVEGGAYLSPLTMSADAISSFRDSLNNGDARSPPIAEPVIEDKPDSATIEDPALYNQWEVDRERKLKRAFIVATDHKIASLEEAITRAKSEGLDPEEISVAEEKIKRLKAMQTSLVNKDPQLQFQP